MISVLPPLVAEVQLLVLMHGRSSISASSNLKFNLCWDDKGKDVHPVERHLNAICIAVTSWKSKEHIDFKS